VLLLLFGAPFALMRDDVRSFRITDDEHILISRGRAEEALHVTDFQEIKAVAARAGRVDDVTGTLVMGKDADLLILAADPSAYAANFRRVRSVMRGGVLRSIRDLSARAQ
jgi:hypothetical protein